MAILEKEVWVGLNSQTINYYKNKKYIIPTHIDKNGVERVKRGTKILVKITDLTPTSSVRVTKICDICGEKSSTTWNKFNNTSDKNIDKCKTCWNREKIKAFHNKYATNNYVAKTHPKFARLFYNEEDAVSYTHQSNQKTNFKCPNCKMKIANKRIQDVFKYGLSCPRCSDGYSYPEKFMFSLLKQLNVSFQTQKSFKWSNGKRYDFYIPSLNCIIETHGAQHYEGTSFFRSFQEENENDNIKKSYALLNGFKEENYIEVNSSRSNLDHMQKSLIGNKKISLIFDIPKIDFIQCHEFATSSIVKVCSNLYNNKLSPQQIVERLGISRHSVYRHLKNATELGWCNYIPHSERIKKVVQLNMDGKFIAEYEKISIAERLTNSKSISNVCSGRTQTSGGYRWMYKEDYEEYIAEKQSNIS